MSRPLYRVIRGKVLLKKLLHCTPLAHAAAEVARLTSLICKEIGHEESESDKIFRLRLLVLLTVRLRLLVLLTVRLRLLLKTSDRLRL